MCVGHCSSLVQQALTASCDVLQEGHIHELGSQRTAVYSAVINETGNMVVGIADMNVFTSITPELVQQYALCCLCRSAVRGM